MANKKKVTKKTKTTSKSTNTGTSKKASKKIAKKSTPKTSTKNTAKDSFKKSLKNLRVPEVKNLLSKDLAKKVGSLAKRDIRTTDTRDFKIGDTVEKQLFFMGQLSEKVKQKIHSIEDGVIYLEDSGSGDRETGITYDLKGEERERFFLPHSLSKIVKK